MPAAGLAARVMGWQRRMTVAAGPLGASGEASNDQPVQVEMWLGGAWIDITGYVMVRDEQGNIAINRGAREEGAATEQGAATFPLRNEDGRFSPRNPMGAYYGLIGRNTPVRVSVPDGNGGKAYRLWGEVPEWPVSWEPTGADVWTDVSASGILRRLAQGPAPERSVIYNAVTNPQPAGLVAYWPCEDATGATSLASALTTGSAMTWTGVPTLASYAGFAASDPLPDITSATLSGSVPAYDDPTATQVRFLAYIPASGLALGKVLVSIDQVDYSAGSSQFWEVYYDTSTNSLTIRTCASDGTVLGAELPHTLDVRGRLLYVSVELQESGANISRTLRLKDVLTSRVYTVSDTVFVTQLTRVTRVRFGPASRAVSGPAGTSQLPGVAVGHVTVETAVTAIDALGVRLNPIGETAGRRMQRLCDEAGLAFDWVGDLDDTAAMGAQARLNLLAQLQECALADGGLLYENPAVLGVGYRTRASLYNQDPTLTLDYPSGQLAQIPTPVEDDRYIQNKVTITVGGVSGTYEETTGALGTALPPAGVGTYGQDYTLNLASSDTPTLRDQAAWRVHLGTTDEARFPQISVNLAHPSITPAMRRAILGMRLGDRVQITNPPTWLPPDIVDQLVLGVSETITHFEHRIAFNCAPASPYSYIGYLDTSARIDTDGSQLLAGTGTADTSIDIVPTSDPAMLWTTDPADVPFDVRVGGEVVRVTAVTPKVNDTFTRTTSSGWGTADTGQPWTTAGGSGTDYSTSGTQGVHSLGTVNVSRYTVLTSPAADVDLRVDVATSVLAAGGPQYTQLVARYVDSSNNYSARLTLNTNQTLTLGLQKRVGGTQTDLVSSTIAGTHTAGTSYTIRLQVWGSTLRAKAWQSGTAEPTWQVTVTDSSLTAAGSAGVRSVLDSTNTNTLPVTVSYDNFQVTSAQTFTVTRSINSVTKAHTAGEDVRLAYPTILAL